MAWPSRISALLTSRTREVLSSAKGSHSQAGSPYGEVKTRREFEAEARAIELRNKRIALEERQFGLVRQKVYLAVTVLLIAAAVVFAALGHSTAPLIAGGSSFLSGIAAIVEGRRAKPDSKS